MFFKGCVCDVYVHDVYTITNDLNRDLYVHTYAGIYFYFTQRHMATRWHCCPGQCVCVLNQHITILRTMFQSL